MLRPRPEARLTPTALPEALQMNRGPLESREQAALPALSASGLEASELPHTQGLCPVESITLKGYREGQAQGGWSPHCSRSP